MTDADTIFKKAENLKRKFKTNDALTIAEYLGIDIFWNEFDKLLGMYAYKWKHRIIILNSQLDEEILRMVAAHELGHDQLHRNEAKNNGFQEFSLIYKTGTLEYEANAFAAHLLIDNDELLDMLKNHSVDIVSAQLNVNPNLVLIKLNEMKRLGYSVPNIDIYNSRFLSKM